MNPIASPAHSLIGSTLTGAHGLKIKVISKIGAGTFGVVYLGSDGKGKKSKQYAVKVIAPVTDADARLSFENEIQGVDGLQHDHLLLPLDHGECDIHGERGFFIIYPYCTDGSYRVRLAGRTSPATTQECEQIIAEIEQILEGLSALHAKTVHRDLKPENILVHEGKLLIGDFGLTKLVNDATRTLTFKGSGTPLYMAPEVWSLSQIGVSADLYAVGVMLFEGLTGKRPFEGDANELRDKHLYQPAPRARSINPHISITSDGVIKKLLHKEPQQRFHSAAEVLQALRAAIPAPSQNATLFVQAMQHHHDEVERKRLKQERASKALSDAAARTSYMEQEVLRMFEEAVEEINAPTPDAKILGGIHNGEATYSFANRTLKVDFFRGRSFPFEDARGPKHGYANNLHENHVVQGGRISVLVDRELRIGWNLVLTRPSTSQYGEWHFVSVAFSAMIAKRFINGTMPVEAEMLTDAYGQHVGHVWGSYNVKDKPLTMDDVRHALTYLLPSTPLNGPERDRPRRPNLLSTDW
jgi:serine/threonine protein kinase